jgi:hypothetical protein
VALVLDYSAGIPGAKAIKDRGYVGAVRYIGLPGYTKNTDADELADFNRHGLGMALVWEHYAGDWRGGRAAGWEHYRKARAHASAIGFPENRPIYMAVDQDVVTADEFRLATDYVRGAIEAAGNAQWRVGVYGEHDVCRVVHSAFPGIFPWQCRAWSGTPPRMYEPRRLYQFAGYVYVSGIGCDENAVNHPDWGQHNYSATAPKEDDMSGRLVMGEWAPGENQQHTLTLPTASPGWFGLAVGWESAQIHAVWYIKDGRTYLGEEPSFELPHDDRWWRELPKGTDQISIQFTSTRPVAYSVELP